MNSAFTFIDKYANIVDGVLLGFFFFLVFFFGFAWKICPLIFHGTMRRIVPELYYMQQKKKQEMKIQRDKFNQDLGKALYKGLAFFSVLDMIQLLKHVPLPKVKQIGLPSMIPIKDLLAHFDIWLENVSLPGIHFPGIECPITPRILIRLIECHLPDPNFEVNLALGRLYPLDILHELTAQLPDIPNINIHIATLPQILAALPQVDLPELKLLTVELEKIPNITLPAIPLPKVIYRNNITTIYSKMLFLFSL
jgi:hypothetical protein